MRNFAVDTPDCAMPSTFVDGWNPQDDGSVKAKSRLVVSGWKDSVALKVKRSAPTPTAEAFRGLPQWLSAMKYDAVSSDLKNAFARMRSTTRRPKEEAGACTAERGKSPARGRGSCGCARQRCRLGKWAGVAERDAD